MQNRIAKNTKQNTKTLSVNVKDLWKDVNHSDYVVNLDA